MRQQQRELLSQARFDLEAMETDRQKLVTSFRACKTHLAQIDRNLRQTSQQVAAHGHSSSFSRLVSTATWWSKVVLITWWSKVVLIDNTLVPAFYSALDEGTPGGQK